MNLIGKWRVAEAAQYDVEKGSFVFMKVEDILANAEEVDRDMAMTLKMMVEFEEGGTMLFLNELPEGVSQKEVDEAVAAGAIKVKDGMMYEEHHWKSENGKNYTDTMPEGEVMGEKVGPWEEVKELENGMIGIMVYHFERIG